jgi:hypothetical protein
LTNKLAALIIDKLKTGSIKNVILFSDDDVFPEPPYVIVKPEIGTLQNTRSYKIIAHMEKGNFDILEDYVLKEIDSLLLSDYLKDEEGSRFKLYASGFTDITPEKSDNSCFMERLYYTPMRIKN